MSNYHCEECQNGIVKETIMKNDEVKIFEKPFVVPSAKIGLCDECGSFNFYGKEMHRWRDLYNAWEAKSEEYVSPNNIRLVRKSLGLNQRDFASFIGVTRQSLSAWENDKRPMVQPQSVDILLQMLFAELDEEEKPATIKMIEEYNRRAGNFDQPEIQPSKRPLDKNKILKNILPQTTWDVLMTRANKNNTDPFTETILSIETKGGEIIHKYAGRFIAKWQNEPGKTIEYHQGGSGGPKETDWPPYGIAERRPKYES